MLNTNRRSVLSVNQVQMTSREALDLHVFRQTGMVHPVGP